MQLHHFLITILSVLTTSVQVLARGINCEGSFACGHARSQWEFSSNPILLHADDLRLYISDLNNDTWIPAKRQIACTSNNICAFVQNTCGMYADEVKYLAQKIVDHGCDRCGSVPVGYPENNDGSKGELTFNFVRKRCGEPRTLTLCPWIMHLKEEKWDHVDCSSED